MLRTFRVVQKWQEVKNTKEGVHHYILLELILIMLGKKQEIYSKNRGKSMDL